MRTRRDLRLFRPVKVLFASGGYCTSICDACDQNWSSSENDLQTSLKDARTIWQGDLGVSSADLRAAPKRRTGTDRQSHSRQAYVQQGELEVRQGGGLPRRPLKVESPLVRQQSASA